VKRAANILKKAGEMFNEKSCRYEELSDQCFECEQVRFGFIYCSSLHNC
jgi:hypothetical protein